MAEEKKVFGYISGRIDEVHKVALNQDFKGQVDDELIKFPKELGVTHPFDFVMIEKTLDGMGLANSGVDKITDSIIGEFTIQMDDENSQALLDNFIENSSFLSNVRPWIKEAISKGNGYMDLTDIDNDNIQPLNANTIFIRRTKKGKIIEYNQFIGNPKRITISKNTVISFKPDEIAHLAINQNPGAAYGHGLIFSNLRTLEGYASGELDKAKLISRKAGAPYHIKVGKPGESIAAGAVDEVDSKMKFMNNRTEWTTDGNIDISVLDFKDVGKNLTDSVNHDVEQFAIGMQIPMVLLGVANVAEGLAKVQDQGFLRYIAALRVIVEDVIESKIFQPLLRKNNLSGKINFTWELPGEVEKNERLMRLNEALKNPFISAEMKAALEEELAKTLDLEELLKVLDTPQEAKDKDKIEQDRIRKEEQDIKQPEVPGAKPTANQSLDKKHGKRKPRPKIEEKGFTEEQLNNLPVSEYVNLTLLEIPGFNYVDYLVKILQELKIYKFDELRALTEQDLIEGLLPPRDVEKLRVILKNGFRKNRTINQIERDIAVSISLKDRIKIKDGVKKVTLSKKSRPNAIARTETVRLANAGLKSLYTENDVDSYRYLAALDDRTSDICISLNGQVFLTKDGTPGVNMPPMHVNCRSTIVGLINI